MTVEMDVTRDAAMPSPPRAEMSPTDRLLRVDAEASRFEAEWRAGKQPKIEAVLARTSPELREALLEELIRVDIELRRQTGEQPSFREYLDRFPDDAKLLELALDPGRGDLLTTVDVAISDRGRPTSSAVPRDLGGYELLARIGAGGMGEVYLARKRDRLDEHRLVVKMLRASVGPEVAVRFQTEMNAMARLQHPHIVAILDSGSDRDRPYFVMPYFPAGDLAQALRRVGRLSPHAAAEYVLAVAWAVAHLHQRGIVHRDLKPSNILLDDYQDGRFPLGRPRVADFGLIKLLNATPTEPPGESLEGTVPYMSPEQAAGRVAAVGCASDVWSIGVMLFEMVAGRRPFEGSSVADVRYAILNAEPSAPAAPRDLQLIVRRCLEKDPTRRYTEVSQLVEDLSAFLRAEPPPHAMPPGWAEQILRWSRRQAALATRLFVVLVLLLNIWINRAADLAGAPGSPGSIRIPHPHFWTDQAILVAWAAVSWFLQRRLERQGSLRLVRAAWLALDALVVTTLLLQVDAVRTPLVAAYLVLVAASGVWFDARLVAWTTLVSFLGYVVLTYHASAVNAQGVPIYELLHYVTALTATGLLVTYMIHRARAVKRMYETRARR